MKKLNYKRAQLLITARATSSELTRTTEHSIASELLDPASLYRDEQVRARTYPLYGYMSPWEATEAFAMASHASLARLASNLNRNPPKRTNYHPFFSSPQTFGDVWKARQTIDDLGIPYDFFWTYSTFRWYEQGEKRMPRITQLVDGDALTYVMKCWADASYRRAYVPDFATDDRFQAVNYTGDPQQERMLDLIEEAVADTETASHDGADTLALYLDTEITRQEALKRFGDDLVERASALKAKPLDVLKEHVARAPGDNAVAEF